MNQHLTKPQPNIVRVPAGPPSKAELLSDVQQILEEMRPTMRDMNSSLNNFCVQISCTRSRSRHVQWNIAPQIIHSPARVKLAAEHAKEMHNSACELRNSLDDLMAKLSGLT